jgi:hypothetical protein
VDSPVPIGLYILICGNLFEKWQTGTAAFQQSSATTLEKLQSFGKGEFIKGFQNLFQFEKTSEAQRQRSSEIL